LFLDEKKISSQSNDSQKPTIEIEPLQQTSGPLQQTSGPIQQTSGPIQQTSEPIQQTSGPLQQTIGPIQQTTGQRQQTTGLQQSLDESFLNALPLDLRQDIEQNIKMQRDQLKKLEKLKSKTSKTSFPLAKNKYPPNLPRLHTRGRPKGSKNLKKSKRIASNKSLKKNSKITEIYNIVKKAEDSSSSSQRSDISEEKTSISYNSPPSLHGSTTLEGVRDAVRSWVEQWSDSYPLDCDVTSVST